MNNALREIVLKIVLLIVLIPMLIYFCLGVFPRMMQNTMNSTIQQMKYNSEERSR